MEARPVVLVGQGAFHDPDKVARAFEGEAEVRYALISTPDLAAQSSAGADALVVASHPVSGPIIRALSPQVKVIGRTGVGVDTVDLEVASQEGITVFNEPSYGETEVASHALAMLLALQRKLLVSDRFVRDGWRGSVRLGAVKPLDQLTVGVVGCGRIGRASITILASLVERVLAYDPFVPQAPLGAQKVGALDEMLPLCDALVLHVPLTETTRGLVGRRELALLPAGAVLVNVARGGVVDEGALAEMLEDGRLGGAGLDVFDHEPLPGHSPLLSAPNTLLSPHVASYSERSMWRLGTWTIGDALSWVRRRQLVHGSIVVQGAR